ncbi:hypothetical protein V7150_21905 [Neobacillus drentensis]|uniref:hypothetical protein n=1 Tax=Neobacillus drentensis TaxID=220684 RepID=UPI002FFF5C7C
MDRNEQKDVFNIFHDGTINDLYRTSNSLMLKIEIEYLAEMINENFNCFYCELVNCEKFSFRFWSDNNKCTDLEEIKNYELEIIDAKLSGEELIVSCRNEEIIGGNLHIKTQRIKLFNQVKSAIPLNELSEIYRSYWDK